MSDLITVGKMIIDWLLSKTEKRTAQIEIYLKRMQETCVELVEIEDPRSEKAALLHEQLKVISEQASERLPRDLIDREGWDLYRGLSSARIYYWLRVVDSAAASKQLHKLMNERAAFSSTSFDALLPLISEPYSEFDTASLARIREQCLNDIAKILEMQPFFRR
jgi:hypothetical protein